MEIARQTITTYADVAAVLQQLARWMERERKANRPACCREDDSCICGLCNAEFYAEAAWCELQEATL